MPVNVAASITTFRTSPMPKKPTPQKPIPLDAAVWKAIKASGMTHYAIGKAAGVAPCVIDRFMHPADDPRHRDIRLETAAKIAAVLGIILGIEWPD
jgi:hypothetical protein